MPGRRIMTAQQEGELAEYTLTMKLEIPAKMREEGIRGYIHSQIFRDGWGEAFQTTYIHAKEFRVARSSPHNPFPSSTQLIAMAKQEWKNREERRGIHNKEDWCCGWMAGFLSVDKPDWVKAQVQAAREDEQRKWRDEHPGDLVWMTPEEEEARIRRDERERVSHE